MEFKKNDLIDETLDRNFVTWSHTLDTGDYVPVKYLDKIDKMIFRLLKKELKQTEIYYLLFLQEKGYKLGLFEKLRVSFSGLRPLYDGEKLVDNLQEEIQHLREELERVKTAKTKRKQRSEDVKTKE